MKIGIAKAQSLYHYQPRLGLKRGHCNQAQTLPSFIANLSSKFFLFIYFLSQINVS